MNCHMTLARNTHIEDIKLFYADVKKLIDGLQNYICEKEI